MNFMCFQLLTIIFPILLLKYFSKCHTEKVKFLSKFNSHVINDKTRLSIPH